MNEADLQPVRFSLRGLRRALEEESLRRSTGKSVVIRAALRRLYTQGVAHGFLPIGFAVGSEEVTASSSRRGRKPKLDSSDLTVCILNEVSDHARRFQEEFGLSPAKQITYALPFYLRGCQRRRGIEADSVVEEAIQRVIAELTPVGKVRPRLDFLKLFSLTEGEGD